MPIKKDGTGKRWVEMEFVTPGTPEQVWQAMATGPGNTAWFTKATIEERVGGALVFDMGAHGVSRGEVTSWEPPRHFGYVERDWAPGAPPVATEITVTPRAGGKCTVRMVHSLFTTSDEWDDQMEGFESGWPAFFAVLRLYLEHFPGQHAGYFQAMQMLDGRGLDVWKRLGGPLGLADASAGDRRVLPAPEQCAGVVECVHQTPTQRGVTLRLESPAPGVALIATHDMGGKVMASVTIYFYGDAAEAQAKAGAPKWEAWLAEVVAPVAS